jgi:hypothetical protein
MTKNTFFCIIVLFFICSVSSCNNLGNPNRSSYAVTFDTVKVAETYYSKRYEGDTANYALNIMFVYPAACSDTLRLRNLQSSFIEKVFGEDYAVFSPRAAVDSFIRLQREYLDSFNGDLDVTEYWLSLESRVVFQGKGLISFITEMDGYYGGAHGVHNISGYVYNLNTGYFLTEDDFAGENYSNNISELITEKIKTSRQIPEQSNLEDEGFWGNRIYPNGNFTVDDKGITYYYNEYEIAAYAYGGSVAFIPYNELSVYIAKNNPVAALAEN